MKKYSKLMAVLLVVAMLLPGIAQAAAPVAEDAKVIRIKGDNRVETAIEVSKKAYKDGSSKVAVLAGYDGEADALTGTLLADNKKAPLLLTYKNKLDKGLVAELNRLGVEDVYVLGGDKVVFQEVKDALKAEKFNVTELKGGNRAETAIEIAKEVFGKDTPAEAFIVQNNALADALAIGPVAAEKNAPIFLTNKDAVPASTKAALEAMGIKTATIVGGTSVVTDAGKKALEDVVGTVNRVSGGTREETAVAIADKYFANSDAVVVANGYKFADALVGGYFARLNNAPILLTQTNKIADYTLAEIKEANVDTFVLGGDKAISETVFESIVEALKGEVVEGELKVESVSAINKTTVQVTFNKAVDKAEAASFTIKGGKVISSTLSEDKKVATLDVTGLAYGTEYTLVIKDVVVDGEAVAEMTAKFTTPEVAALWDLEVVPAAGSIEADGTDNTTVTFQLVDKVTGEVDKNANDIVLDLNTTYGSLAQKRTTIQNGTATVVLRSEFNAKGVTAKVEAQIIEASGDYTDLIGKVSGSANVVFAAPGSAEVDAVYLTAANTNEADRVTLTFDKAVSVADFVQTNVEGELTGKLQTEAGGNGNSVSITQGASKTLDVKGFLPGPTKNSLIAVLKTDTRAVTEVLTDNSNVKVVVEMENSAGKVTESEQEFKFTDARVPQVTSVTAEGMNRLVVKFSEPIAKANFLIDGKYDTTKFTVKYGEFKFDPKEKAFVDERNIARIKLDSTYDEDVDLKGYFKAGAHTLETSAIYDFAALSDNNNIGTTQSLEFNVAENKDLAVASVKVDSPNQYRIAFDKDANVGSYTNAATEVKLNNEATSDVKLEIYDEDAKEWVNAIKYLDDKYKLKTGYAELKYEISKIDGDTTIDQYKVRVTSDWQKVYATAETKDNYYNDKFRVVIKEEAVITDVNGRKNVKKIELPLNFTGSAMNEADVTSPVISKIEATSTEGTYEVTMSEPIEELYAPDFGKTEVEFIGKDKEGKTRTFKGGVSTITNKDGIDTKFNVEMLGNLADIKTLVADGGSEDWTLSIKNLTDHIGNKAATVTKSFKITKAEAAENRFRVDGTDPNYLVYGNIDVNAANEETITITFTDKVSKTGNGSAINVSNYTLNGKDLPTGTSISVNNNDLTVVIKVKKGTLSKGSNIITLGRNLVSKDGIKLTGEIEFAFEAITKLEQAKTNANTKIAEVTAFVTKVNETNKADAVAAVAAAELAVTAYTGLGGVTSDLTGHADIATVQAEINVLDLAAANADITTDLTNATAVLNGAGDVATSLTLGTATAGSTITWTSNNTAILTDAGIGVNDGTGGTATLTAKVNKTVGSQVGTEQTKTFTVVVNADGTLKSVTP